MISLISRIFSFNKLDKLAYFAILISIILVYYRFEPSPADCAMALAAFFAGLAFLARRDWRIFSWLDVPLILYLFFVVVQAIIYRDELDVRFALISTYLFISYLVVKYVVAHDINSRLNQVWLVYVGGAIVTSLVMIVQMIIAYSFGGGLQGLYHGRPNGWFEDSNVAGPFLLPAIFYCYYWFLTSWRWKYLSILLLLSLGLFLSFSRGAYLGYTTGLILLTLLHLFLILKNGYKPALRRNILYVAIAMVSIICLWLSSNLYQPFAQLTSERFGVLIKDYDTQGRAVSWETSIQSLGNSPFGSGSGSYEEKSIEYQQSLNASSSATPSAQATASATENEELEAGDILHTKSGEEIVVTPSAHNTYLRVLLENGLVGLALLLVFWLGLALMGLRQLYKLDSMPKWAQPYLVVTLVSFLAFLPMGTYIDTLHWRFLWIMAGILAAILASVGHIARKD